MSVVTAVVDGRFPTARVASPLVFVDVETDGVGPDARPWEVALIRREMDGSERWTRFFVELGRAAADPAALRVGGFYSRHPVGRFLSGDLVNGGMPRVSPAGSFGDSFVSRYEAAVRVARWTHGAHLVGVGVSFDARVLEQLLLTASLRPGWHYHLVDVVPMAAGWLNALPGRDLALAPVVPPWSSDDLSRRCGVSPPEGAARHTALGDARWARRWWDALTSYVPPEGLDDDDVEGGDTPTGAGVEGSMGEGMDVPVPFVPTSLAVHALRESGQS